MAAPEDLPRACMRFSSMNDEDQIEEGSEKNSTLMTVTGYAIDSIIVMAIGVIGLGMITMRF